ncbi:zf-HC2 domain-containing protein [Cellvibrio sp. OA-2007]|uniref:zf-HC2 domain-containing protein n=1 Tax=Cellvibrio sp. OA-2007 TaxID=529823 RepID=UPI0007823AF2|nr:zf-HC2 domain-containing protein [Cellvibrio sp. OA-2007]
MLSCKQVAALASDYLDRNSLDNNTQLKWQIRLHLLMCANCRRFVRHLKITQQVGAGITKHASPQDAEMVWKKLQAHIKEETQSKQK